MSGNGQTSANDLVRTKGVMLDAAQCYRALAARDARFDGVFFVGVKTTGIYCRPVCRARTPREARCVYFARAVDAERDGFRACFRCRPELAPGHAPVDALSRHVRRAMARIEEGALNEGSLETLARELGITGRHLRRAMEQELGCAPVVYAQSRRLALAKQLLHETALPMADVAFAAGFQSVRRFNAAFARTFRVAPSRLRSERRASDAAAISLRLDYRPPLAWPELLAFLAARAIKGVEVVSDREYARTLRIGEHRGVVRVAAGDGCVLAQIGVGLAPVLMAVVAKLRALFDLDAEPTAVAAQLARDPFLRPHVARTPGLRVPGTVDPFEISVRAVLGQQVSVAAATTLCGRFVDAYGDAFATEHAALTATFPAASAVATLKPAAIAKRIRIPEARARTIVGLARAQIPLGRGCDPDATIRALQALDGIGPWTASYIAMRALRHSDALPAGDLVLRQKLAVADARGVEARAEAWRPWRAYGVMHTWRAVSNVRNDV